MGLAGVYHPAAQRNQGQVERTWLSLERRQEMLAAPVWCSPGPLRSRSQGRISRGARDGYGIERNSRKARWEHLQRIQDNCLAGVSAPGFHANVRHAGQSRRLLADACGDLSIFQLGMRVLCSFTVKHPPPSQRASINLDWHVGYHQIGRAAGRAKM